MIPGQKSCIVNGLWLLLHLGTNTLLKFLDHKNWCPLMGSRPLLNNGAVLSNLQRTRKHYFRNVIEGKCVTAMGAKAYFIKGQVVERMIGLGHPDNGFIAPCTDISCSCDSHFGEVCVVGCQEKGCLSFFPLLLHKPRASHTLGQAE